MAYPDTFTPAPPPLPDANTLLSGGAGKYRSLSFGPADQQPPIAYNHMTVLALPQTMYARNDDFEIEYWNLPNSNQPDYTSPKLQIKFKLRLAPGSEPDPRIVEFYGEDDLIRFWFTPGSGAAGCRNGFDAVTTALRVAKVRVGVRPGGDLSVRYVEQGPPVSAKKSGKKFYEAIYVPPPENWVDPLGAASAAASPNGYAGGDEPPPPPFDDEPPF